MEEAKFTKEQYESGEAFRFLDEIEDETVRMIQRNRIAKELGVKDFNSLYKEHRKQLQAKKNATSATRFTGQTPLLCGSYQCDDYGIRKGETIVCLQPIYPCRTAVNVEDQHQSMEIKFKVRNEWRSVILPQTSVAKPSEIIELAAYGVPVSSENAKRLGAYLMEIEYLNHGEAVPIVDSISRLGWVGDEFAPYGNAVVFDGSEDMRKTFAALSVPSGQWDEWLRVASDLRSKSVKARLILAGSFASAILEKVGALNFVLHIWGQTGYGKTVAQMLAASVWGNPELGGGYVQTFDATATGKEVLAGFLHNVPLMLDELQIAVADGNTTFYDVIYKLCDATGRTRATATLQVRQAGSWRLVIMTTGEQMIVEQSGMAGAITRSVQIELDRPISDNMSDAAEALKTNYGHAGRRFVKAWANLSDDQRDEWKRDYATMRDQLHKDHGIDPKRAASIAALYVADKFAGKYLFQADEALTVDELLKVASEQLAVDPNKEALQSVLSQIEQYKTRFLDEAPERWGYFEDGETPFDGKSVYILSTAFEQMANNGKFAGSAFLKWANRSHVIAKSNNGRNTYQVRDGSRRARYVVIDLEKADEILSE